MSQQKGALSGSLIAGTTTNGGDVLSLANPEGVALIITKFILRITTPATGTPTVDAGVAADGSTSSDTLLDGQAIGDAAKVLDNVDDQGTNGQATEEWGASEYVTITPSASAAGLVGTYYIEYVHA